jgi:hypothetical protein
MRKMTTLMHTKADKKVLVLEAGKKMLARKYYLMSKPKTRARFYSSK